MTTALKEITDSLMTLPQAQRIEVADTLYRTANQDRPEEIEQAWSEEIKRRLDEYHAGKAVVPSEEEVNTRIQKVLDETRQTRLLSPVFRQP